MHITRQIWLQLGIFAIVSVIAVAAMTIGYMQLPNLLFGAGHYIITVQLPEAGGLYERANVTYRGTEVGQVKEVQLTDSDVEAVLSLRSDVRIPSDLTAEVHSASAVGEQYIALIPRNGDAPPLKSGDRIPIDRTTVPPDIGTLLDATDRALAAIPGDNLQTVIDESYIAFGGLGPEIARSVRGATALASGARHNLDDITNLVDKLPPVLDTQTQTSDSVQSWTANLADVTRQIQANDAAFKGLLATTGPVAGQGQQLIDRLKPTLPVLLANMVSVGQVAVAYRDNIEQLLVLLPQGTAATQATGVANKNTQQPYRGAYISFNLNLNVPPPCLTGFLPATQMRVPTEVDAPDRPAGDLYCRVPQDSPFNVRGARNTPCATVPGKRAPTVKMCESDQDYVPLNDGYNWKGDPNATLSGQPIPQVFPDVTAPPRQDSTAAATPPIAAAEYDPATGTYSSPDGRQHAQANLAADGSAPTWQSLLLPPGAN